MSTNLDVLLDDKSPTKIILKQSKIPKSTSDLMHVGFVSLAYEDKSECKLLDQWIAREEHNRKYYPCPPTEEFWKLEEGLKVFT